MPDDLTIHRRNKVELSHGGFTIALDRGLCELREFSTDPLFFQPERIDSLVRLLFAAKEEYVHQAQAPKRHRSKSDG